MKIFEIGLLSIAAFGIIMKLLLMPGADELTGLSMSFLIFFYFLFGFFLLNSISGPEIFKRSAYKGISFIRGVFTFLAGITISLLTAGIMYKSLQITGAQIMLFYSLVLGILVLIILSFLFKYRKKKYYKKILLRISIYGIIALGLFFTPSLTLVKIFHRDDPEFIKQYESKQKEKFKNSNNIDSAGKDPLLE